MAGGGVSVRDVNVPVCLSSDCAVMLLLRCNNVNLHDCRSLWLCMTTGSLDRKRLETEKKKKKKTDRQTPLLLSVPVCLDRAACGGGGARVEGVGHV